MRYLFAVIADLRYPVGASPEEAKAIDAFNDKIDAAGIRILAAGIATPNEAKCYDNRKGMGLVHNGPAVESNLFMAGFWIIEAEEASVVQDLALEASLACNRTIEVRPFLG